MQKGELLKKIISLFETLSYRVKYEILNLADYGVPQIRERIIIFGTKLNKKFNYPVATYYNPNDNNITFLYQDLKPYVTLADAISDLPFIKNGETSFEYLSELVNEFQKMMRRNTPQKKLVMIIPLKIMRN